MQTAMTEAALERAEERRRREGGGGGARKGLGFTSYFIYLYF